MTDNSKITNISDARNRVTTNKGKAGKNGSQRVGASSGKANAAAGYDRAMRKQKGGDASFSNGVKWFHYVQLLLLLGLVVWLMRSCSI